LLPSLAAPVAPVRELVEERPALHVLSA
jgi:hypothetical protein